MRAYPLLLEPILKHKVWGGRRLGALGKDLPDGDVGESWEVADLAPPVDDGRSRILNGELTGRSLGDIVSESPEWLMGSVSPTPSGGFPLLVKYLDACANLSVQVHPTAAYVAKHPDAFLKSEAWIVVSAEPGAVLYRGLRAGLTAEMLIDHVDSGAIESDLIAVPARVGDCHYLPSGTCHALGAGIVVAEIQTPSDTTFRLYDWGRQGRTLHLSEAIECIDLDDPEPARIEPLPPIETKQTAVTTLARTEYFVIERIDWRHDAELELTADDAPEVWMTLSGGGRMSGGGETVTVSAGTTALVPASLEAGSITACAETSILRVTLPGPTEGLLA